MTVDMFDFYRAPHLVQAEILKQYVLDCDNTALIIKSRSVCRFFNDEILRLVYAMDYISSSWDILFRKLAPAATLKQYFIQRCKYRRTQDGVVREILRIRDMLNVLTLELEDAFIFERICGLMGLHLIQRSRLNYTVVSIQNGRETIVPCEGLPLVIAALFNIQDEAKKFLESGQDDVDATHVLFGSPLNAAAYSGHINMFQYLLAQGANLQLLYHEKVAGSWEYFPANSWESTRTPLSHAAYSGHMEMLEMLMQDQYLPESDEIKLTFIRHAVINSIEGYQLDALKYLCLPAMMSKEANKDISRCRKWIRTFVDLASMQNLPLLQQVLQYVSADCGFGCIVANENDHNCRICASLVKAMSEGIGKNKLDIVQALMDLGIAVDRKISYCSPPVIAYSPTVETLNFCLESIGATLTTMPGFDQALLHYAEKGNLTMLKYMLESRPVMSQASKVQIFVQAVEYASIDIIAYLWDTGLDLDLCIDKSRGMSVHRLAEETLNDEVVSMIKNYSDIIKDLPPLRIGQHDIFDQEQTCTNLD